MTIVQQAEVEGAGMEAQEVTSIAYINYCTKFADYILLKALIV